MAILYKCVCVLPIWHNDDVYRYPLLHLTSDFLY